MADLITDPNHPDYDADAIAVAIKAASDAEAAAQRLLDKERKEREKEQAELAKYREDKRLAEVKEAFEQAELASALAKFFPADKEASKEAARAWAEAEGLATVAAQPQPQAQPTAPAPAGPRSFVTSTPGGLPAGASGNLIPIKHFDDMQKMDPQRAAEEYLAAVKAGRVQFDTPEAQEMANHLTSR